MSELLYVFLFLTVWGTGYLIRGSARSHVDEALQRAEAFHQRGRSALRLSRGFRRHKRFRPKIGASSIYSTVPLTGLASCVMGPCRHGESEQLQDIPRRRLSVRRRPAPLV